MLTHRPPARIADLGCGTGNIVPFMRQAWPAAAIECVDLSSEMLAQAKTDLAAEPNVTFTQADLGAYTPTSPLDVIFSNAALHWLTDHGALFPKLISFLAPGGLLAVQMPDTRLQPSHLLMRQAAINLGLGERVRDVRVVTVEGDGTWYYSVLKKHCAVVDIWSTTYIQSLQGVDSVADFTRETGLKPFMAALGGEQTEQAQAFETEYRRLCRSAYPASEDGAVLFPFTRMFIVAKKL